VPGVHCKPGNTGEPAIAGPGEGIEPTRAAAHLRQEWPPGGPGQGRRLQWQRPPPL
jgi:hypothetical protein